MVVTKDTEISKIINEKYEAIEAIASINKHFLKLKNPILRKILASRINVKEASKIGSVTVNEFLKKLENIGFHVDYEGADVKEQELQNYDKADKTIQTLDVRPTIASGQDPFKAIMHSVKQLKVGEALQIINVFEPVPLIKILQSKNYKTWTEVISNQEYHTYVEKQDTSASMASTPIVEAGSLDEVLMGFGGNIKEIDVRLLEMPEPMVTILTALSDLPENHALLVNHKKVPQFLLPELEKRAFKWLTKDIELGHVLLLIYK